ncbi:MarR family winged helix-turn-helix transcriptional regulator [Streptomyces sp. ISL-86]|uniref:MarR family winged helix-turn-helix transcriptional regulator n=1 Tax=Streptomyces sp. ISL-86 TaxID=2819187 RepID=UPI001BE5629B|nr:MarR family transcriptional regulator [Streptomyces sp. ISL-86]MBT2456922.1 MarR family transcriptional regulator [Streptomyces sp. ISL-86]
MGAADYDGLLDDEGVLLLGKLLRVTHLVNVGAHADIAKATGLRGGQFEVLLRLARHTGRTARINVLADQMSFSSGGFTRFVDRMERDGLLYRSPDPDDRRAVRVTITGLGDELLRAGLAAHAPGLRGRLLDPLSAEEQQVLHRVLDRLDRVNEALHPSVQTASPPSRSDGLPSSLRPGTGHGDKAGTGQLPSRSRLASARAQAGMPRTGSPNAAWA